MKLLLNIGDTAVDNDVDEGEDIIVVDDCDESQCKRKRFQTTNRVLCTIFIEVTSFAEYVRDRSECV